MSSILESIKKEQLQARKDKDKIKTKSLTTIIGEIDTIVKRTGKEVDDVAVSNLVKKTIENLRIVLEHTTSDKEAIESEIQLDAFVLKQLTEERIRAIKKEIVARDAKTLMQFLNTNYKGRFDGKLAMQIVMKKKSFKLFFYYSSSVLSLFNSYSLIRKAEHKPERTTSSSRNSTVLKKL